MLALGAVPELTEPANSDAIDEARRTSFDRKAELYDAVRPSYPAALADDAGFSHVTVEETTFEAYAGRSFDLVYAARARRRVRALVPGRTAADRSRPDQAVVDRRVRRERAVRPGARRAVPLDRELYDTRLPRLARHLLGSRRAPRGPAALAVCPRRRRDRSARRARRDTVRRDRVPGVRACPGVTVPVSAASSRDRSRADRRRRAWQRACRAASCG